MQQFSLIFNSMVILVIQTTVAWNPTCDPMMDVSGPCHHCQCKDDGGLYCELHKCDAARFADYTFTTLECIPHVKYHEGLITCQCSNQGIWLNDDCRKTFSYVGAPLQITTAAAYTGVTCDSSKGYIVDCNFCVCKNGFIESEYCTNNQCNGHLGVTPVDLTRFNFKYPDRKTWELTPKDSECTPNEPFMVDCNICECSEMGFVENCTTAYCGPLRDLIPPGHSTRMSMRRARGVNLIPLGRLTRLSRRTGGVGFLRDSRICAPNTTLAEDGCNECKCTPEGYWVCAITCPIILNGKPSGIDINCTPSATLNDGCNDCLCSPKGYWVCTVKCPLPG